MADFKGQALAEHLYQILLLLFAVGGFGAGYILQSFRITVYIIAAGTLLTSIIVLPDWPFFNTTPIKFIPEVRASSTDNNNTNNNSNNNNSNSNNKAVSTTTPQQQHRKKNNKKK
eukprot:TRINITY_DN1533_c0_g1_i2.p1 TRINITY_DN1533_c0_g1~~TRINITY_DN1533_c0_g1_i2.p1  ORF type:complete len:115 (-),score=56.82 TRINITY_DN1533_c0_g1_i2:99-443(-)